MTVSGVTALGGGGRGGPHGAACPALRQRWAPGWAEDAVGADLHASLRQDVREEAAHTRCGGQRPMGPQGTRPRLAAAGDGAIFALDEAVLGDGDAGEGRGAGGEPLSTSAGWLTVGHPALRPDLAGHGCKETGGAEGLLDLAPEACGEGLDGPQPSGIAGCEPRRAVRRQGAARHARMAMRRVGHLPGPGMPSPDQAELAAHLCGV
jgi:hypothetical protein